MEASRLAVALRGSGLAQAGPAANAFTSELRKFILHRLCFATARTARTTRANPFLVREKSGQL